MFKPHPPSGFSSMHLLKENNKERSKRKRDLSRMVSSRSYSAPEVILTDVNYDKSLDIWSLGCILYMLYLIALMLFDVDLEVLNSTRHTYFMTK